MAVRVSDDTATLTKQGSLDVNSGSTNKVCVVTKIKISLHCMAMVAMVERLWSWTRVA